MYANETLIRVTDEAVSKLREIMVKENKEMSSLKLAVVRTHCMDGRGFANSLAFEDSPTGDDELSEHDGIKIYVDQASARYLKGAELDYVETLAEVGFKVNNPHVVAKCPCGSHDIFE